MPRIPTHQFNDDWEDPNDQDDDQEETLGRKAPKDDRKWVEQRKESLQKRHRDSD